MMNKLYEIFVDPKTRLTNSLTFYIALISMIILPVYHWYLPPLMILWGVTWLISRLTLSNEYKTADPRANLLFVIFILFFIWQIIGMVYSDNPKAGWRNISLHLSLFLFPLVLVSPGNMIQRNLNSLLRVFVFSTFLFIMVCFGFALYRSLSYQNGLWQFHPHLPVYTWLNYFYSSELAIYQHRSYLSMYVLFSVFISLELFFDINVNRKSRIIWLFISIILLVSIYFLSSRAGILATIVSVIIYVFFKVKNVKENRYLVMVILGIILISVPVLLTNPRVHNYINWKSGRELSGITSKEGRITIWKSVNSIMKQNIFFGVGTGDIQDELNKEYIRKGNNGYAEGNFNSHNQFIEIMLENGLIGLILFLSIFGIMFYFAVSELNILYIVFLVIVFISFLFETMLNRLAGVSFFSLFSFLLLHLQTKK